MKAWKESLPISPSCSLLTYCHKKVGNTLIYNYLFVVNVDTSLKCLNVAWVLFCLGATCRLSLLVLGLLWRSFSGFFMYGFSSSLKTNIPNSNLTRLEDLQGIQLQRLMWLPLWTYRGYYMPTSGYEFYLQVFNSISHEWTQCNLLCNHNDSDLFTCKENMLYHLWKLIWSFHAKAHVVFHWCLYNKVVCFIFFNFIHVALSSIILPHCIVRTEFETISL